MECEGECPYIYTERTLAIIKPDCLGKADEIEEIILQNGFTVLQKKRFQLSIEQASEFYVEHYGKLFFPSLVSYMSSGQIIALVIAKNNAISCWRQLIGPTSSLKAQTSDPDSIRAKYGTDDQQNAVHGSDNFASAEKEIKFFFPDTVVEPIPVRLAAKDYLAKNINRTLLKGLTEVCKHKPHDPVIWLADWLIENNPNKPLVK